LARLSLTVGALLPYWAFLTFRVVFITDDYFASDIFNGELPGRALIGSLLRQGQLPVWTSSLCSGLPLAGSPADPIGLASFTLLPPGPALDLFIIVLLLVAAHGAYSLAMRFGADRVGAVLAGLAFAGSGYVACQLKHLAIVATVVWLPVGLVLLDAALAAGARSIPARWLRLAAFGLVFGNQVLCGFPQSAYICAIVYAAFVLFRTPTVWRLPVSSRARITLLGGVLTATVLGAAAGAVVLLPLSALGSISDRAEALGYDWSTRLAYWPPNALTFLFPYVNGDISNASYDGPPFFWEDYGYVGLLTLLLAVYAAVRQRRRAEVAFMIAMTVIAYLFVLGRATPIFHVAYLLIPGMKIFRFPTRFLIVVELGLAVLGAIGLTRLRTDLASTRVSAAFNGKAPAFVAIALCALTGVDLFIHQPRQNPTVDAATWLAPPASVPLLHDATASPRTFTPRHRDLHRLAFINAEGWKDVAPYYQMRDLLQPNLGGGFWNTPSADCYAGISASWYVNVWGDHNREAAMVPRLAAPDINAGVLKVHPLFGTVMKTYGVTHVLSPYPQQGSALPFAGRAGSAYVYRVNDARRVRFVRGGRAVTSDSEAVNYLLGGQFDPDREVLLHDASGAPVRAPEPSTAAAPGRASITYEDARHLVVEAEAPQDGYLLVADTYSPGWTARIDGHQTPIYRADVSIRALWLPRGRHLVQFTYDPPGLFRGAWITLLSLGTLLIWLVAAAVQSQRAA
jgi:hypothetical protein